MTFTRFRRFAGFTLIELMIVLAVLVIIITLAAPSFNDALERRRLAGAGDEIFNAVNYARSEAIMRNTDVLIRFTRVGEGQWCYGIDDDLLSSSACNCLSAPDECALKVFRNGLEGAGPFRGIDLDENKDIVFKFGRGEVDAASTMVLSSSSGKYDYTVDIKRLGQIERSSTPPGLVN
jgi:type IV fimbrial biogenesis protein FimT